MTTTNPSKHTSSKSSRKRSAHKVHTLPLATMAALLTAATCLGSQPAMAVAARTPLSTPTYTATAKSLTKAAGPVYQDREADVVVNNPEWLKTPSILEFQRYRSTNDEKRANEKINSDEHGSDEYNTLIKKTDMYAHIETIDGAKYLVFDVFFNNDAQSMVNLSKRQWYIWQVPYQIAKLNSDGSFTNDTIRDLRFDAYKLKDPLQNDKIKRKVNFTLSRDFAKFEKVDNQSTTINFPNDHEKNFGGKSSMFQYSLGPNLTSDIQYETNMKNLFHENHDDYAIGQATYPAPPYSGKNYGIGIQTSEVNLAFHMHAAVKLNNTAINEKATTYDEKYANIHNAWTWADSATYGRTTSSSYVWLSGRDPESDQDKKLNRHKDDREAPKIYYNGKEITDDKQTIQLYKGDTLSFTTTDNKGYIEKFSISGLTKDPTVTKGAGSEDKPLSSGDITVTKNMKNKEVTITSEDGSGNVTTRKVKVTVTKKKTLAEEHPLTGKTIYTTVGETLPPLTEIDKLVEIKDGDNLDKKPTLKWNGTATPNTDKVGVFTPSIKGEYSDKSKSFANVTINVKPKKPVIDTDLTDLAGKKGQKVTVSVGSGIPTEAKVTTTVKLFDKNGKEIGSTTTINGDKAEITVNGEIPAGDVYATTTVTKPDETSPKGTTKGFNLTSENSDKKQATAPKDTQAPTITATATSSSVTVGQNLKIHIVAKDDVKVDDVPNAQALMQGLGLQITELSSRIKSSQTTNTDTEKDFDLTVKNMQPKEVGTHTITFTVTDSAGKTGTTTLTITVKPAAPTVNTPTSGDGQGSAKITPATDTDSLEITYTPEGEDNPKTITVKKDTDGKWKKGKDTPEGVTVDETTGEVTIPANKIKDNSDVTAKDSKNGTKSEEKTGKTGTNPSTAPETKPAAPTVNTPTSGDGQGSAKITPATDTDSLEITYTPEGEDNPKTITVKKDTDGKWKIDGNTPDGVTVDETTGEVTIPANKIKDNSDVTAKDSKNGTKSEEKTGKTGTNPSTAPETKPAAPTVNTPTSGDGQGSAKITPATDTDSLEITYTPEGEDNPKTITVKKDTDGKWKIDGNTPDGVTVDETTGEVTIPANKIQDGSKVTAVDKKGKTSSDEATGNAGNNDGNSGSGTGSDSDSGSETGNSESGNSNGSGSDSGNDSTSNNGGSASGSTTGGSSSTDSGAQNSTNKSSSADNANNAGNAETGNADNGKAGSASTGASGSNASNKSGNKVPAKHSSQLVNTGAEVERVGLISAMIAVLGAAAAFFSRKKNRE